MADPVTLAVIGMGATAAGTGIKMFGEYEAGEAKSNIDNYKAQVALQNARYEQLAGEQRNTIIGLKGGQRIGGIIAGQGGSGILAGTGSYGDVIAGQKEQIAFDERQNAADTARRAYGLQTEAGLLQYGAKQEKTAAGIQMAGTFASGVASLTGKFASGKNLNIFGSSSESQVTASDPYGLGDYNYDFGLG